jgi:hypothetical protein
VTTKAAHPSYPNPAIVEALHHKHVRLRAERAIRLLDEWMADESGYDEETWPELKAALDRDRLSSRRLFDE